jgi:bile acid:Na+ symporter, BASS family
MASSPFTAVGLPLAIALIMGGLGLSLTPQDFRQVLTAPRAVTVGLVNLAVLSPLLALTVAELFGLAPTLAVGLVLLGASPGGMMASVLTHLSRGDTALSVTMTAISSVASAVTIPLFLGLATSHFGVHDVGDPGMAAIVARVFAITVVPVAIGVELRRRRPDRVAAVYPAVRRASLALFAVVVVGAVVSEQDTVRAHLSELAGAAITMNLAAMSMGLVAARLARLDVRQATAIALELGVHNSALAIAVGTTLDDAVAIPAAVYSSVMLPTGIAFARTMARRSGAVQ